MYTAPSCLPSVCSYKAGTRAQNIELVHGDLRKVDWSDGELVFANSTCFSEPLIAALSERAEYLRTGSIVVTMSKPLTSAVFELLSTSKRWMAWGVGTVYVQRRSSRPRSDDTKTHAPFGMPTSNAADISTAAE